MSKEPVQSVLIVDTFTVRAKADTVVVSTTNTAMITEKNFLPVFFIACSPFFYFWKWR